MDGRAPARYRPLPPVTAHYRPDPQHVQRTVTRANRPHQHLRRRAALARGPHQRVAREHRVHGEGADAEHVVTAHEQGRPMHRLARRPQPLRQTAHGVPHLHVRALPMAGQMAGSMQWVGQIQSANETYRVRSGPVRSYGVPGSPGTGATSIARPGHRSRARATRSEEHTSELQSLITISYAVFCLKKKKKKSEIRRTPTTSFPPSSTCRR